jgi:hypothetical protein
VLGRLALLACTLGGVAYADDAADTGTSDDQIVLVNAAPRLGDIGVIAKLRRSLGSRGMLFKLPEKLEATLDGRNLLIADLDALKDAYASGDFASALKIIESDEARIVAQAANGDPIPALAQLAEWRGIIAAALNEKDEALRQFRFAYRLNPAWLPDKHVVKPNVRAIIKKAHREPTETGFLHVDADPDGAKVQVDGGEQKDAREKIELPIGLHLVLVTAPSRASYAELVDIEAGQPFRMPIALDKESKLDRAARLVDETAAAPAGKSRLKRARELTHYLSGPKRVLVVEDGSEDHVTVRLYDVELKKVSNQIQLDGDATPSAIAHKIQSALDPENLLDASAIAVASQGKPKRWYERWYVWAGVAGVAAVAVGGVGLYEASNHAPTMLKGF